MLLRFSASNYLSFAEEQEILFTASPLSDEGVNLLSSETLPRNRLLPAIVIYGPNASGKSNFLSSLENMAGIVINSHKSGGPESELPYVPFLLDENYSELPTSYELDFIIKNSRFNYSFSYVEKQITSEALTVSKGSGTSLLFERTVNDYKFGRKLTGPLNLISSVTRANSLFLSAAAQNNHRVLSEVYDFFTALIFESASAPGAMNAQMRISRELKHNISKSVISFLTKIGTGVVDYQAVEVEMSEEKRDANKRFRDGIQAALNTAFGKEFLLPDFEEKKRIELGHRGKDGSIVFLGLELESAGTRRLLTTLPSIFKVLETGGFLCFDEVDASLHTLAADLVLALFANRETNPHGAQILASTHDTNLLDSQHLRRDQVWFAEKTHEGKTRIYPLTDFKPRKSENMEKSYLQGRYGAIPRGSISRMVLLGSEVD